MSQDLQAYFRSRKHLGELRWGPGLAVSLGLHLALGAAFFWPRSEPPDKDAEVKVTWVNLPAATTGTSGGSEAMEVGKSGDLLRRVEEVAPVRTTSPSATAPDPFALKSTKSAAKGDNKDATIQGTGTTAAKGKTAAPNPMTGAVERAMARPFGCWRNCGWAFPPRGKRRGWR